MSSELEVEALSHLRVNRPLHETGDRGQDEWIPSTHVHGALRSAEQSTSRAVD